MQASKQRTDSDSSPKRRSNYRWAIGVSMLFHLILIGALLYIYVPASKSADPTGGTAIAGAADSAQQSQSRSSTADLPTPDANPEIPPQQIEASMEAQIREAGRLTDERKLSELEKNLSRLQSISTEESVSEVTATIAGTLGLEPGPSPAENPPSGELDPDTVQIHDVQRNRNESGDWEYTSILVDAQGRTESVPMSTAEGETVYSTFEQMKRFPVAAGIYRQVVMPMIQKMIVAKEVAEQAAIEAERLQSRDGEMQDASEPSP